MSPLFRGLRTAATDGVAITFDDGPDPDVTPRVLEILASADAVATFFLVGERALLYPELVRAVLDGGHSVGNHTQTHRNLMCAMPGEARDEISRCQQSIESAAGIAPRLFRAPWGKLTPFARRACRDLALTAYDWTVAPEGWPRPAAPREMVAVTLAAVAPGCIVDLHDVPWHDAAGPRSIEALPQILAGIAERGLATVALPEARLE